MHISHTSWDKGFASYPRVNSSTERRDTWQIFNRMNPILPLYAYSPYISSPYTLTSYFLIWCFCKISKYRQSWLGFSVKKKNGQKQTVEERVYFSLQLTERSQSRNLEAGTEAEAMGKHCLQACSHSCLSLPSCLPAQGWDHPQWIGPFHINHSSIKKMADRRAYRPVLWKQFLN